MKKSALKGVGLIGLLFAAKSIEEVMVNQRQAVTPGGPAPKRRFLGMMGRAAAKTVLAVASKGITRR